jgi:hypothetical protein
MGELINFAEFKLKKRTIERAAEFVISTIGPVESAADNAALRALIAEHALFLDHELLKDDIVVSAVDDEPATCGG